MSDDGKEIPKKSSTLAQWRLRKNRIQNKPHKIQSRPKDVMIPLSPGQKRLWFLQELHPENPFYNYTELFHINGSVDVKILLQAFEVVGQRHESLRSRFIQKEDLLQQAIQKEFSYTYEYHDLSHKPKSEIKQNVDQIIGAQASHCFDLEAGPLVIVSLICLQGDSYVMNVTMPHIITDKWSMRILREEMAIAYKNLKSGNEQDLVDLPVQYADFAYWKSLLKTNPESVKFWLQQLKGVLPILSLPCDYVREDEPTFKGAYAAAKLPEDLSSKIKAIGKEQNATMFVVFLAAFKMLLQRYSGLDDIIVGTPYSNRDQPELERIIGFFNETLVLRSDLNEANSFYEVLAIVKETVLKGFEHKDVPFESLVKELKPERAQSSNPIFQVMFLFHEVPKVPDFGKDFNMSVDVYDAGVSKFDLTLYISEEGGQFTSIFEYATDLFSAQTIDRMQIHLLHLLTAIAENPSQKINEIQILSDFEQTLYSQESINENLENENPPHVLQRFQEQLKLHKSSIAVASEGLEISYELLDQQSNILANALQVQGAKPNDRIGLFYDRSADMIAGILAVLKLGATYVPLDSTYPWERIEFIINDAQLNFIVAQEKVQNLLSNANCRIVIAEAHKDGEDEFQAILDPETLAYIIYTSGSTGRPKGVKVNHRNLAASTLARDQFYEDGPQTFLLMSSFAFDSSIAGIFWTLCTGGTLLIPPHRIEQDLDQLGALIAKHKVSHTLLIPSLYQTILAYIDAHTLQSLQTVIVAGEACLPLLCVKHFETLPAVRLYNEYGPTEATVWCSAYEIVYGAIPGTIPIGKPTSHASIYILDKSKNLCPIGVPGELFVGGVAVAQGYWNRDELTARRFVDNPFSNNENAKLYRTGDLAKYNANGELIFLGRVDRQVKIRGYRIEPDEIQQIIEAHSGIEKAVVIFHEHSKQLRAYYTTIVELNVNEVLDYVRAKLPEYMVPQSMTLLDAIPLLPNGKVNYQKLPDPSVNIQKSVVGKRKPKNETESKLLEIWQEVLQIDDLSIDDNFFEIGGDSIISIQIISKARKSGIDVSAQQLFAYQTVEQLALFIVKETKSHSISRPAYFGPIEPTPIQLWFFEEHQNAPHHWNQCYAIDLNKNISVGQLKSSTFALITNHEALRLTFIIDDEGIKANAADLQNDACFLYYKVSHDEELEINKILEKEHSNLNVEQGPLFKVLFFERQNKTENRIFLLAHHLVIDAVSWNRIIQDLEELILYDTIQYSGKTGYKEWSDEIISFSKSEDLIHEISYWASQSQHDSTLFVKHNIKLPIEEHELVSSEFCFDQAITLQKEEIIHRPYNTKTDEIILTAVLQSLQSFGTEHVLPIYIERLGRESLPSALDFSEAVGWFTSFYPLLFELKEPENVRSCILEVKEKYRNIPHGGLGFGALKYMNQSLVNDDLPLVVFNFLGRQNRTDSEVFSNISFVKNYARHPKSERRYAMEINAQIVEDQLRVVWTYPKTLFSEKEMTQLQNEFSISLKNIEQHCIDAKEYKTPSDFDKVSLSQTDLNRIVQNYSSFKISELLPTSSLQQALLFHHLQDGKDEGLLHVECDFMGSIDQELFRQVVDKVVLRHDALRSAIYWDEGIDPVQVYFERIDFDIAFIDSKDVEGENENEKFEHIKQVQIVEGIDVKKMPLCKMTLVTLSESRAHFICLCHHINLDGWSASNMISDIVTYYHAASFSKEAALESVPTAGLYYNWVQSKNGSKATNYWKVYLAQALPSLLHQQNNTQHGNASEFLNHKIQIDVPERKKIARYSSVNRLTINSMIQGLWAILLSAYLNQEDIIFGTAVSGRSGDLPNIEFMVGLFMNILPVRMRVDESESVQQLFQNIQDRNNESSRFEDLGLHEILASRPPDNQGALFNTLVVFENFPDVNFTGAGIQAKNFSGGITSTYPLTLITIPGNEIQLNFRYDKHKFTKEVIATIASDYVNLLTNVGQLQKVKDVSISTHSYFRTTEAIIEQRTDEQLYKQPATQIEFTLVNIWESILQRNPIGVHDDFFTNGGTSLQAIQIFSAMQMELGISLSPVLLLQHRNISALSQYIQSSQIEQEWTSLVPLRREGWKRPLFCFHAGGGHVLFYKALADALGNDQPVYALQPVGLDGEEVQYQTVEEMAYFYLEQMRKVQSEGPYHLLATCFSNAVTFELVRILEQQGERTEQLIIVDSGPPLYLQRRKEKKLKKLVRWLKHGEFEILFQEIGKKFTNAKIKLEEEFASEQEKNLLAVRKHLNQLLMTYEWTPQNVAVLLIRSREFQSSEEKNFHISAWTDLALKGLETEIVETTHYDIFEKEGAEQMAGIIETALNQSYE